MSKRTDKKPNHTATKNIKIPPIVLIGLFDVIILVMLATVYANYLRKIEGLSLFLPTEMHYSDCMQVPGGLILWISTFLTQAMYYPWAGAAVFVLLIIAIQALCIRAFRLSGQLTPVVLIPSVLITLAFTNLGYLIFTLRPVGCFLSLPVGLILALCLFWGYRVIRPIWLRYLVLTAIVVLGYHFLGFYALLAGAMCALSTIFDRGYSRYCQIVLAAAVIVLTPYLWFTYIGRSLMQSQMYLSGIPYFYKSEVGWWLLYGAVYAIMLIGATMAGPMRYLKPGIKRMPVIQTGILAAAVIAVVLLRYSDRNFMHTLDLDRAIWDQDWQTAVKLTEEYQGSPDRINTVLGYVALRRTGLSGDRMFGVKYGWEPYNTSRNIRPMHDAAAAMVSYQLGLTNYANRWCMEYNIGQGMSVERIMLLAKCALLNYELPLAKTYLEIVYNTPFRKDWAKRYLRYVSNPMEMNSDPELSAIRQLMCHPNQFINDGGAFESYIWPHLASSGTGTPEFNELSMQAALIVRDLDAFMPKLQTYLATARRVPRYYQEAALLWSVLNNAPCPPFVDPQTAQRHERFLSIFRSLSQMTPEEQRDMMKESFADTYWYYFIFTEDQQAI